MTRPISGTKFPTFDVESLPVADADGKAASTQIKNKTLKFLRIKWTKKLLQIYYYIHYLHHLALEARAILKPKVSFVSYLMLENWEKLNMCEYMKIFWHSRPARDDIYFRIFTARVFGRRTALNSSLTKKIFFTRFRSFSLTPKRAEPSAYHDPFICRSY